MMQQTTNSYVLIHFEGRRTGVEKLIALTGQF